MTSTFCLSFREGGEKGKDRVMVRTNEERDAAPMEGCGHSHHRIPGCKVSCMCFGEKRRRMLKIPECLQILFLNKRLLFIQKRAEC